jgi:uncharacterized surface protein with fasciclin (FAS1) repeats
MKNYLIITSIVLFVSCGLAYGQGSCSSDPQSSCSSGHEYKDVVDTAVSAGSFKTLVAAVKAADLVDALKGEGPFTVFAPTDEAFAKLPKKTLSSLLKPENRGKLTAILTYHVVPGQLKAKDVLKKSGAVSLNGQRIDIKACDSGAYVDKAKIVKTDIICKNGIIHVIDSVILPNSSDIVATAQKTGSFKTLIGAVRAAKLTSALQGKGPFTVFAPTDEAFAKLPPETLRDLLKPENRDKLTAILTYHVIPKKIYSERVVKLHEAETLQKDKIKFSISEGSAYANNSKILSTDIDAANGVIHVIDTVLIPPSFPPSK